MCLKLKSKIQCHKNYRLKVFLSTVIGINSFFRLVAIYGFATCAAIIVFGAAVGHWIDKTARLKAARTFLIVQNIVVVICCTILGEILLPKMF